MLLDLVPLRMAELSCPFYGMAWGLRSGLPVAQPRLRLGGCRVAPAWPAISKTCMFGKNDLKLLVSYNLLVSQVCLYEYCHQDEIHHKNLSTLQKKKSTRNH